jgi:Amt family ammonium transporter
VADASSMARIFANTNLAAAGGVVVALLLGQILYKKVDLTFVLNGALGGLVSITAEPLAPSFMSAVLIGGVGGALVIFTVPLLDKLKIDDVVGAIPVHLVCGIWGTLAVPITNDGASFSTQLIGIVAIGAFVLITSFILWFVVKAILGVRLSETEEKDGADKSEIGLASYPEFTQ